MLSDSALIMLIKRFEQDEPHSPGGTFADVLDGLRELQRWRKAIPGRRVYPNGYTREASYQRREADGWNACVDAMEKAVNDDPK